MSTSKKFYEFLIKMPEKYRNFYHYMSSYEKYNVADGLIDGKTESMYEKIICDIIDCNSTLDDVGKSEKKLSKIEELEKELDEKLGKWESSFSSDEVES